MSMQISGIRKQFASTRALDSASLDLPASCVTALIGENGAGKSTLIKILTGSLRADSGTITWRDAPLSLHGPLDARAAGIAVLHQEPQLVDALDGLENLFIGRGDFGRGGLISRSRLQARAQALLQRCGFTLPLARLVRDMSPAERTLLGFARCLLDAPSLLILDEPTASLTAVETGWLASAIAALRAQGAAVLFVSHRLDEVLAIADRVVVMRNGRVVESLDNVGLDHGMLVAAMSGPEAAGPADDGPSVPAPAAPPSEAPIRLKVEGLATRDMRVRAASLEVRAGEIVGIYGLAGAGRTELLEAIYGARAWLAGRIEVDGRTVTQPSPSASLNVGMCLVPEDRKRHALMTQRSLLDNLSLSRLQRDFATAGIVDARLEQQAGRAAVAAHGIRAAGLSQPVGELSGGNQQKAVFARAIAVKPGVLLCDEPTQAVDVLTRRSIHALLREHAAAGGAVLAVTSDIDELVSIANRVLVMREGCIAQGFERASMSTAAILEACFPPRGARAPSDTDGAFAEAVA